MRRLWRRMRRSKSLCLNRRSTRDSVDATRYSVDDQAMGDSAYKYLTADEMKSLGDDSVPMDTSRDETMEKSREYSTDFINQISSTDHFVTPQKLRETYARFCSNVDNVDIPRHPVTAGFLVSFMVDARGGAMRGCRHSGVRVIVPPRKAAEPTRITCRYLRKERLLNPPPLMEGEALASRILEMGPAQAKFLGAVIIEVPHFASLRGREREIVIMRSDNGQTWKEHCSEASEETVQDLLNESFDGNDLRQLEDLSTSRRTRIITTDFPLYFAVISRLRQEIHTVGPEGGMVSSTVVPQVQAVFPPGALTKKIKVGLQAQPIPIELVSKLLGNRVAVSPIATIEPRRRKFHKPITLTIPVPEAASQGMINSYSGDSPSLRLLCSITGGTTRAQWEDVTGSTPLTFVNDCVSFTTTVSARFWLVDCQNFTEATSLATELYREAIHVPFFSRFVVFAKRHDSMEGRLRVFCMTDDKEEKTLEQQEHFIEVARSRDVEVMESKWLYLEFGGNLVPFTKTGDQLCLKFRSFKENRLRFTMRIKDVNQKPMARVAFMKYKMLSRQEDSLPAVCTLNVQLPSEICPEANVSLDSDTGFKSNYRIHAMLPEIAEGISDHWQRVAEHLGLGENDIELLSAEYSGDSVQQATAMLRLWINSNTRESAGEQLSTALQALGLSDVWSVVNGYRLADSSYARSDPERSADNSTIEERNDSSRIERVIDSSIVEETAESVGGVEVIYSSIIEERPESARSERVVTPRFGTTADLIVVQLSGSDGAEEQQVIEHRQPKTDVSSEDKSHVLTQLADTLVQHEKIQPKQNVTAESQQDVSVDEPLFECQEKGEFTEITNIQSVHAQDLQQSSPRVTDEGRTDQLQQTHETDHEEVNTTISTTITTTTFPQSNDQPNELTSSSTHLQKDGCRIQEADIDSSDIKLDEMTDLDNLNSEQEQTHLKDEDNGSLIEENIQSFQERREFWEEISSASKEEDVTTLPSGMVNQAFLGEEEVDRMEKSYDRAPSPYEVVRDVNNVETVNLDPELSDMPIVHDSYSSSVCEDSDTVPDEIMTSHSDGKAEVEAVSQPDTKDGVYANSNVEVVTPSGIDSHLTEYEAEMTLQAQSNYVSVVDEALISEAEINLGEQGQETIEPLNSETHPHILDESESVSFVSETLNDILDAPDDVNGSPVSHSSDIKISESDNKFVSEHLDLIDEFEYDKQAEKPSIELPSLSNQHVKFDISESFDEVKADDACSLQLSPKDIGNVSDSAEDIDFEKTSNDIPEEYNARVLQSFQQSEMGIVEAYAIASDIVSDIKTLVMEHPDIKSVYIGDESENNKNEKADSGEADMSAIILEKDTNLGSGVSALPKYSPDSAFTEQTSSKVEAYLDQLSSSDARHVELVQKVTERKSANFEAKRERIESFEITDEDLCGSGNDLSPVESHIERLRQMSVPYLDDEEIRLLEASAGERKHTLNLHALQLTTTDQYRPGDVKTICSSEQEGIPTESVLLTESDCSILPQTEASSDQTVINTNVFSTESAQPCDHGPAVDSTASITSTESSSQSYVEDCSMSSASTVVEQKIEAEISQIQLDFGPSTVSLCSETTEEFAYKVSSVHTNENVCEDTSDVEKAPCINQDIESDTDVHSIKFATADDHVQAKSTIIDQNVAQQFEELDHSVNTENQITALSPCLNSDKGDNTTSFVSEHSKGLVKRLVVDGESPSSAESRYYTAAETGGSTSEGSVVGSRPTSSDVELLLTNPSSIASGSQDYVTAGTSPSRVSPSIESETSGHMASGEISEQSDTLLTSTVEFEREATPTGHIDNEEIISDNSKEVETVMPSPKVKSDMIFSDDDDICLQQSQQNCSDKSEDMPAHSESSISSRSKDISECSEANDVTFEDHIVGEKQIENEFGLSPDASMKSDRSSHCQSMKKLTVPGAVSDLDNSLFFAERSGTESQFANETWQTESDRQNTSSVSEHLSSMTSSQTSNATLQPSDEQMSDEETTLNNLLDPPAESLQSSAAPTRDVSSHRLLRSYSESASSILKNRTLQSNYSEEKAEWEVERIMSQPSDPNLIHGDSIERPPSPAMENYPSLIDVCSPCQTQPILSETTWAEESVLSTQKSDDFLCDSDSVSVKTEASINRVPDTIIEEDEKLDSKTQFDTTSPDEFILVEGSGGRLDTLSSPPSSMTVISEVCFFPPEEIQKIDDISPPACDGIIDEESPKQWAEMQFEDDLVRIAGDPNYGNTLEDIEEEDAENTDIQLQKLKETLQSSAEFETHLKSKTYSRNNGNSNRSDSDEVSMCSLQEFERLESLVGQRGSEDSVASSGAGQSRGHVRQSSHGDNISVGSLQEFESLEHQCDLTEQLEARASRAEQLLSEIEEGHESQMSESDSGETLSDCESTSHTAETERSKLFEVDQMIREAQANMVCCGAQSGSGLEVTDLTNSLLTLESPTQSSYATDNRLADETSENTSSERTHENPNTGRS